MLFHCMRGTHCARFFALEENLPARVARNAAAVSDAATQRAFDERYANGVRPAPAIRAAAAQALAALRANASAFSGGGADGETFDCVHMRRRDFVADHKEEVSVEEYAEKAAARLAKLKND